MPNTTLKAAASGLALMLAVSVPAIADEFGTAEDAKAMLAHVVEAMAADEVGTIELINAGDSSFVEGDIYPFCGGPDGMFTAHAVNQSLVGTSLKELEDHADNKLGADIYAAAEEGATGEVAYMWPRPGESDPTDKVAFVTKIGDHICAVGYYK